MGLAPSGYRENTGNPVRCEVPVPIFSQPLCGVMTLIFEILQQATRLVSMTMNTVSGVTASVRRVPDDGSKHPARSFLLITLALHE